MRKDIERGRRGSTQGQLLAKAITLKRNDSMLSYLIGL